MSSIYFRICKTLEGYVSEGWEAMEALEGWEAMSRLENRWGREGAALGRVGDKLLHLVKYGNKKVIHIFFNNCG